MLARESIVPIVSMAATYVAFITSLTNEFTSPIIETFESGKSHANLSRSRIFAHSNKNRVSVCRCVGVSVTFVCVCVCVCVICVCVIR